MLGLCDTTVVTDFISETFLDIILRDRKDLPIRRLFSLSIGAAKGLQVRFDTMRPRRRRRRLPPRHMASCAIVKRGWRCETANKHPSVIFRFVSIAQMPRREQPTMSCT